MLSISSQSINDLVELDYRKTNRRSQRYIMTYIDECTEYAVALTMDKFNSRHTERLFDKAFSLSTFAVKKSLPIIDSEFKGQFLKALE